MDAVRLPALRGGDADEAQLTELVSRKPIRQKLLRVPHAARRHQRLPGGDPVGERLEIRRIVRQRLVDKHGEASLDEGLCALHMFASDIGCDDYRVDVTDDVGGVLNDVRDERALRDMFRGETTVADAIDVSDLRAWNRECLDRLLVEVNGNSRERTLARHDLAVVPVEHRAPGIRMSVSRGAPQHGEPDFVGILDEAHR